MLLPSKDQPRGPGEQPGGRRARPPGPSRWVLAQRSSSVVPVGIWVESALGGPEQSPAFASASRVEEELRELEHEKAAGLRRFQGEVKRRVNHQVRMRRKQQLQRSCELAERESCLALHYSGSVLRWPPRKDTCLFRGRPPPTICGPSPTQQGQSESFQQRAAQLSKTVKQVRRRLASCRTILPGAHPPELPGGIWRREKPESGGPAMVPAEEESEELLLAGHHDLPAELQEQGIAPPCAEQDEDFYIKIKFEKFQDGSVKVSRLPEPPQRPRTDGQAPLVLWAGVDQEETKKQPWDMCTRRLPGKELQESRSHLAVIPDVFLRGASSSPQRQSEFLRCRRLFMSIEREQAGPFGGLGGLRALVLESTSAAQSRGLEKTIQLGTKKPHVLGNTLTPWLGAGLKMPLLQLFKNHEIKRKKEKQRRAEEQRLQEMVDQPELPLGEGAWETLAQLQLEERSVRKVQEKQQRNKEHVRYIEALRAQLREKIKLSNIDLPPLCSCGSDFWDSHPDTCANNCIFYKNHRAYSHALQSVVSSCVPVARSPSGRLRLRDLAALCARSGKRL
ncbi:coiled-coil domain-containing protein 15 [Apus apus]|uniref:coiled-coil domain-containing protein 15 n=1 Tax=Apus apus TaxID=8895 RepID=UPI0021F8787C|nr:coiled-coil domain-containing protein 15 [Apus apus]